MSELYKKYWDMVGFCLGLCCLIFGILLTPTSPDKPNLFVVNMLAAFIGAWLYFLLRKKMKQLNPGGADGADKRQQTPSVLGSKTYQQLLDETKKCQLLLSRYKWWAIACFIGACAVIWVGYLSGHPQYRHPLFTASVFGLAFLVSTKNLEKERELDIQIVEYARAGMKVEETNPKMQSAYFQDFAKKLKGVGMARFIVLRIGPAFGIVFAGLKTGILNSLIALFPTQTPDWATEAAAFIILGSTAIFLGSKVINTYKSLTV